MPYTPKHLKMWKHPECYVGATWPEYYVVYGMHRDSPLLTEHNFGEIKSTLKAIEAKYPEWDNPTDHETAMLVNPYESHWAVGHVEWLGIHKDSPEELIRVADELLGKLESYPILNEDEFSTKEWEAAESCWAQLSLRERIELCAKNRINIFAARHNWIPQEDNGNIFDYCRPE